MAGTGSNFVSLSAAGRDGSSTPSSAAATAAAALVQVAGWTQQAERAGEGRAPEWKVATDMRARDEMLRKQAEVGHLAGGGIWKGTRLF